MASAQQTPAHVGADEDGANRLSEARVRQRLDEAQASTTLDEDQKLELSAQYRRVLEVLDNTAQQLSAAESFRTALQTAASEAESIRAEMAAQSSSPESELTVSSVSDVSALEAALGAARTRYSSAMLSSRQVDAELEALSARPLAIRTRQAEIRSELPALVSRPVANEQGPFGEASSWLAQANLELLNAESERLRLELESTPARRSLLAAKRDRLRIDEERSHSQVETLTSWLTDNRLAETEQLMSALGSSLSEDVRQLPAIVAELALHQTLADGLAEETALLNAATAADAEAAIQLARVEQRLQDTRQQLEVGGVSQALGRYLAEERRALTVESTFETDSRERQSALADAALRGVQLDQRRRELLNTDAYVQERVAQIESDAEGVTEALVMMATQRRDLLHRAIEVNHSFRQTLSEVDYRESQRHALIVEFDALLSERLLWVRNAEVLGSRALSTLPTEVAAVFGPSWWLDVAHGLGRLASTPLFWLCVALFGLFLYRKKALLQRLHASSAHVGDATQDRVSSTFLALLLSLTLALPWALLTLATGYLMNSDADTLPGARAVGSALQELSPLLIFVLFFRSLTLPKGVAEMHLQLSSLAVQRLRRNSTALLITFFIPAFLVVVQLETTVVGPESALSRVLFLSLLGSLALFFYRLLRPKTGIAHELRPKTEQQGVDAQEIERRAWTRLALALAIPLFLAVMVVVGYTYSASLLLEKLLSTLWLVFGLILLHELVVRWIQVSRRRALVRVSESATNSPENSADEPSADEKVTKMSASNADTQQFANTVILVLGLFGLASVWSPVLAAFNVFSNVELWQASRVVDGEQVSAAVTLFDVLKAAIVTAITVAAVRHVPAVVEVSFRHQGNFSAGSRLAFATLGRYAVSLVGGAIAVGLLGINWENIQWLVAALGVGIGFGLQDIVANVISGLFILIERPIRIGDVITVGDASGTVRKIRIRATTIRTWDEQELLVPNREIITGRVLNWTLSDTTIRIYFKVGIAYGSNVKRALELLKSCAVDHPHVLDLPVPIVTFEEFGDSSLTLGLRCYVGTIEERLGVMTELHEAVNAAFSAADIEIAFPQRDIHLDTRHPLELRVLREQDPPKES